MQTFTFGSDSQILRDKVRGIRTSSKSRTSNARGKRLGWEVPLLISVGLYIYCGFLKVAFPLILGYFESYIALLYF